MTVDPSAAHRTHCNQGEYVGSCKYGQKDSCPSLMLTLGDFRRMTQDAPDDTRIVLEHDGRKIQITPFNTFTSFRDEEHEILHTIMFTTVEYR